MKRNAFRRFWISIAITLALFVWLYSRVSPRQLLQAAQELAWFPLFLATGTMVIALYLWDSACLPIVYAVEGNRWSYRQSLHLRGLSYLGGAVNYELGQAALAWSVARLQDAGLVRMLSRSILLAYHDVLVLLTAGWVGSLLTSDERIVRLRPYLTVGLIVAGIIAAFFWFLPTSLRRHATNGDGNSLLDGWSFDRSLRLILMRFVYFGILVSYAAISFRICRLPIENGVTICTMPLVLLADGLPNFAGLGTRDTAMQLLLLPSKEEAGVMLAMSLFWSTGLILGRLAIALPHLWLRQIRGRELIDTTEKNIRGKTPPTTT
jgi:hypothetical protein